MRKLFAVLLLALLPAVAVAQQFPTVRDGSVIGRVGTGSGSGPSQAIPFSVLAPHLGCSTAGAFVVGTGTSVAQCSDISGSQALINGGPLTITPPANTLTQGLVVTQSGPTSGTTAGPFSYNLITVIDSGNVLSGSGSRDTFDLLQDDSSAFRVNDTVGGIEPPIRLAGTFAVNYTGNASSAETVGLIGSSYSNTTVGALWGAIGYASLGPSGTASAIISVAAEVGTQTGAATLTKRVGFLAMDEGPIQGSSIDGAFVVTAQDAGRGTPAGFKNAILISNTFFGATALDTHGNFISADSATTLSNFVNGSNISVQGNILLFPNLNIPGAPSGFTLPAHGANVFQYGATNASGVAMEVDAFTGPAQFVGKRADTSSTAPSAVQNNETIIGISAQPYDGSAYSEIGGLGIHAAQNLTGSNHGSYLSFFTTPLNSTTIAEAGRFGPSGALLVGTTTDAAAGVVNVLTGFRISNAAASGHYLRGNGTSYIDGTIAYADLPSLSANQVLGALTATTPSGLSVPSCSTAASALLWTLGSGFSCNTSITASAVPVGGITGLATGVGAALATAINTNGGFPTVTTNSVAAGAIVLGAGSGTAQAGLADVATGALVASGGVGSNPSYCTACTITTSLTTPTDYGGSAVGSTKTINGTSSGSPSSANLILQSNGQKVGIGNSSPNAILDISANLTTNAALTLSSSLVHIQAADTNSGGFELVSFGAGLGGGNLVVGAVAAGTAASPTAPVQGQYMYNMRGYGYNSGWQLGGLWGILTDENWSAGHQGTHQDWYTTPSASTTIALRMRLQASGGLWIGDTTATDPGAGKVAAQNGFQSGSSAGLSVTKTVRASGGAADCTLIYTGGILTGGTC